MFSRGGDRVEELGEMGQRYKLLVIISSGDVMHSMATIVNDTVLYI